MKDKNDEWAGRIAILELHPDRVDDLMHAGMRADATQAAWMRLAGIGILACGYLPKNRGWALDSNRQLVGVVVCESSDPAEWTVLSAPKPSPAIS